jgi:protein-disulfide isomerase
VNKVAWIIFGAVIIVAVGALVIYSHAANPSIDVSKVNTNAIIAATDQSGGIADHVFGSSTSKVTLIEYGDFQCPYCGQAHPQIEALTTKYQDKIAFIFRNFPLTTVHPNARAAAAAVEAAGLQGKYWDMHNLLYETQSDWNTLTGSDRTDKFASDAVSLGINKDQFLKDFAGSAVDKKISFDQALGKKLGVDSTPTFYLDGTKISDTISSDVVNGSTKELQALIDKELAK